MLKWKIILVLSLGIFTQAVPYSYGCSDYGCDEWGGFYATGTFDFGYDFYTSINASYDYGITYPSYDDWGGGCASLLSTCGDSYDFLNLWGSYEGYNYVDSYYSGFDYESYIYTMAPDIHSCQPDCFCGPIMMPIYPEPMPCDSYCYQPPMPPMPWYPPTPVIPPYPYPYPYPPNPIAPQPPTIYPPGPGQCDNIVVMCPPVNPPPIINPINPNPRNPVPVPRPPVVPNPTIPPIVIPPQPPDVTIHNPIGNNPRNPIDLPRPPTVTTNFPTVNPNPNTNPANPTVPVLPTVNNPTVVTTNPPVGGPGPVTPIGPAPAGSQTTTISGSGRNPVNVPRAFR